MKPQPLRRVLRPQCSYWISRQRRWRRHLGQQPAIRPSELERAVGHSLELVPLFVHGTVMTTTQ